MVCVGVLGGFLLFALLSLEIRGGEGEDVDLNKLANIIKYLEERVRPLPVPKINSDKGNTIPSPPRAASVPSRTRVEDPRQRSKSVAPVVEKLQYAVAVAIPKQQCVPNSNTFLHTYTYSNSNTFLENVDLRKIQDDLKQTDLHEGAQLIAATPQVGKGNRGIHSERRLLMCLSANSKESPLQVLLNNNPDSCVIFYTYNSPCLNNCLNSKKDEDSKKHYLTQKARIESGKSKKQKKGKEPTKPDEPEKKCILDSLESLVKHKGPKAFVFNQVYQQDINLKPKLEEKLKEVSDKIPLYRCNPTCNPCKSNDINVPINHLCTDWP